MAWPSGTETASVPDGNAISSSSSSRSGVHAAPKEGALSGVQEATGRGGEEERKGWGVRGAERGGGGGADKETHSAMEVYTYADVC